MQPLRGIPRSLGASKGASRKLVQRTRSMWGRHQWLMASPLGVLLADSWKGLGAFLLDGLQRARVEAEELEDGRCDLGRLDRLCVGGRLHRARCVHEDGHVTVARVVAAVFGDLASAGVDDTDLYAAE